MKNVADIYALTPMQQLMMLHTMTDAADHDVLFNQIVYRLSGDLNAAAFQRAWQHVVDRHPVLRTLFVWQKSKDPVQVVREQVALPWIEHDWRAFSTDEQEQKLAAVLAEDRQIGFDLLRPPLMRIILIRQTDDCYWMVWSSHHLILDRWCIGLVLDEMAIAYAAYIANSLPILQPAPRFRDYVGWLDGQDKAAARRFWREQLGDLDIRPLPLISAPTNASPDLATLADKLTAAESTRLSRFALDNNLTIGTLLPAAWAIVMSAATNSPDVLFGQTVSGRPAALPEVDHMLGSFINNIPLRIQLDGSDDLLAWLQAIQEQRFDLQPYEYVSPTQIQSWTGNHTLSTLFDTLLVMQSPVEITQPIGLELQFERGRLEAGYAINLEVVPQPDSLQLKFTYDRQRVPHALINYVLAALRNVLVAMPQAKALNDLCAEAGQFAVVQSDVRHEQKEGAQGKDGAQRPYIQPRTGTEIALLRIWAELLRQLDIGIHDNFFDAGGNSIAVAQHFALVEERLGVRLPLNLLFQAPTIAELAAAIEQDDVRPIDPVLVPINLNGTRPPFFFAHGIFGDVLSFTNIAPLMPLDQPLYGFQAFGMQPANEPDQEIETMAARYISAMRDVQPTGPYHLGGFCFGAIVAYEMARQLEQAGETVALLALIEGSAPREYHNKLPLYHPDRIQIIRQSFPYWANGYKEFGGWRFRERVKSNLHRIGIGAAPYTNGTSDAAVALDNHADFNATRPPIQHKLRTININALENYVPRAYNGRITLFRARALNIGYTLFGEIDPQRGWGGLARGGVDIRYVDGTHVGILQRPYAADLAAQLTAILGATAVG